MSKSVATPVWRENRRAAARQTIVDAAWELVRVEGLAGLSIRDLAKQAGVSTPTLYAYFDSKHAIYDAMFAQGQRALLAARSTGRPADPVDALRWNARTFVTFCTEDPVRYQLLFQRTIPGFLPSEASFALALENLDVTKACLAAVGLRAQEHLDVWTGVWAGVTSQQIANDVGGTRWVRHVDTVFNMYLDHYLTKPKRRR